LGSQIVNFKPGTSRYGAQSIYISETANALTLLGPTKIGVAKDLPLCHLDLPKL